MTPRDKAIELMDKYWQLDVDDKAPVWTEKCKQCCLIAVDELIEVASDYCDFDETITKKYWQEVKQEIEKL
jgi:hypothetical protein